MSSSSSSIKDEIDVVKAKLPDIQIITATKDFVTVSYEKTPSRRVKATLTFPDGGYPNKEVGAIVDITGVVPGLKKKWDKELTQLAKDNTNNNNMKAGTNNNNHNPIIFVVLERLQQLVDTNRFVPCWRELKQSVELLQQEQNESSGKNKGSGTILSMNEAKGLIKLKMTNGKYHYTCNITIDEGYPTTLSIHDWGKACSIRTSSTNLPSSIESAVTKRCQEFVRHLQDGMPEKIARSKMGVTVASSSTSSSAKKNSNTKKLQQTATSSPPSQPQGESDSDWKAQETAWLSNYDVPTYDGSNPQPSLLPLVKFMVDTIQTLPQKVCPICGKPSFPTDPTMLASFFSTATKPSATPKEKKAALQRKRQRPMQPTSCGACWYHYQCLNEFLTQPPFGDGGCPAGHDHCSSNDNDDDNNNKSTTTTKNTVTHPDWTSSRQELEQAWAGKQARQREMDDVAMMF